MFNEEFYPTPPPVAHRMMRSLSKDAERFLEPSAGKGDLAHIVRGESEGYRQRREVDCIETDYELVEILRGKDFRVVGNDFLTYPGVCCYDAIVMNPPFSEGVRHLLHAWDFMHDGEIVCLLNAETIRNPYTAERRRLMEIIGQHGRVDELGQCFRTSQRSCDVEVAMVYLRKQSPDDLPDLWATDSEERRHDDWTGPEEAAVAIRDELGNMEQYYNEATSHMLKAFTHLRKAAVYMNANRINADYGEYPKIPGIAFRNVNAARAEWSTQFRRDSWKEVFDRMQFHRWLDKKQRDAFIRDIERDSTIPFTADNIKGTLANILEQRTHLFELSCWSVFEELTRYFKGNTNHTEGWKSNSDCKVNKKLVFPYGCSFSDDSSYGTLYRSFSLWRNQGMIDIYNDLDRCLCVLKHSNFDHCFTVGAALDGAFKTLGHQFKAPYNNRCQSQFFDITFYQKGTVHLKWRDEELMKRFNKTATAGRLWLGGGERAA